jgi:antitoxin CptB
MTEPTSHTEIRRRRLLFRATHRGTHETDLLIGGYVESRLAALTDSEMDALEEVMADWLTGRVAIPPGVDSPMLRAIKHAADAGHAVPGMDATR